MSSLRPYSGYVLEQSFSRRARTWFAKRRLRTQAQEMNKVFRKLLGIHVRMQILRAFQPGDIVFIECDHALSDETHQRLGEFFAEQVPQVKCVVLGAGMRVAAREEHR